jgi:hypothetical protein
MASQQNGRKLLISVIASGKKYSEPAVFDPELHRAAVPEHNLKLAAEPPRRSRPGRTIK